MKCLARAAVVAWLSLGSTLALIVDFESAGAVPDDSSTDAAWSNGALLNQTLAALAPFDTLLVPNKTFTVMGGIFATGLEHVTIQLDGTLAFSTAWREWPTRPNGDVLECFELDNIKNVTITSSGTGTFDGQGYKWWGLPGLGYLHHEENRPRLMRLSTVNDVLVENVLLKDSPYWTFYADNIEGLEVRYSTIDARRMNDDGHNIIDLTAFNTDGFDVNGRNVWIHDCTVWNQDDSFCVKGTSSDMVFERIEASGLGLTIGSVGSEVINNITFRDAFMKNTVKGVYMKFRDIDSLGVVSNIVYENIVMDSPQQWAIWIGPAQQSDTRRLCAAHPCSICWPELPSSTCKPAALGLYENITLRNITINNPGQSPGVILANETTYPMVNIVFEDVVVNDPPSKPWGDDYYLCEGVASGVATGNTWPVPPCFEDQTTRR